MRRGLTFERRGIVEGFFGLIRAAQEQGIDFVYAFHPGKGLRFSAPEPAQGIGWQPATARYSTAEIGELIEGVSRIDASRSTPILPTLRAPNVKLVA